jgi:AcrR family transcriptional regulator
MESAHTTRIGAPQNGAKKPSSRSKRELILATATADFARVGYRASKWSDVADSVGIGSTALYHYFVSKDHCLFTIMAEILRDNRDHFHAISRESSDPRTVIKAAMRYPFEGGAAAADRHRVVMAEMHLLSLAHSGPEPEHAAYLDARGYAHDIVHAWTRYLENLMRDGEVPAQDPHLLARAVIGLCAYPFAWYDPNTKVPLEHIRETVVAHALGVVFNSAGEFAPDSV